MAFIRKKVAMWWILGIAAIFVIVLFTLTAVALRTDVLRPKLISALANALNCDVALDKLDVRLVPRIQVIGSGLSIRLRNRAEIPPFIEVDRFTVNLGLLSMWRREVDTIHLDGLRMNVPPQFNTAGFPASAGTTSAPTTGRALFTVRHVIAHEAMLNFVGRSNNNRPLNFAIHDVDLQDAGISRAMRFAASVTNPIPEGLVATTGTFGPWNRTDPTQTPLAGNYDLTTADLGTINGIGGQVASTGEFSGLLTDIHVVGASHTADFSLDLGGRPVSLRTTFDVTVDGTNGTTRFNRVDAVLVSTPMVITGAFTSLAGPGHDVKMAVEVKNGHIEDLLELMMDTPKPVMLGDITVSATFKLPPGAGTARKRLAVAGTFGLARVQFTDKDVVAKLADLSRRGQGKDQDEVIGRVATSFSGQFSLAGGVASLPRVGFSVPGAKIALSGQYIMGTEAMNFVGTAQLNASLSDAVGGFRSILIKPFNRLFSKDGSGAIIPIEITGTRSQPNISVRMKQIFKKEG